MLACVGARYTLYTLSPIATSGPRLVKTADTWEFPPDGEPSFAFLGVLSEHEGDYYFACWNQRIFDPSPDEERELFRSATLIPPSYYLGDSLRLERRRHALRLPHSRPQTCL
ncbi:hypothetical protein C8R45DRAFT_1208840 [Mycena sanguinolenta]|nr:hypothetical protein C8R45DRAFT_1208840 [Mycena sanguinolenta]